jgi:hypothetical protein
MSPQSFKVAVLGLTLSLLGLLSAEPLLAQSSGPPSLLKHLRGEIESRHPDRQAGALVDVIALANCPATCVVSLKSLSGKSVRIENETGVGRLVDLDALVPALVTAYRTGGSDGHRLLALSALLHVGNETGIERLVAEKEGQNERVRKMTDRQLTSFYLAKYPELRERTLRMKGFSLDDVYRAERLRAKQAKKGRPMG